MNGLSDDPSPKIEGGGAYKYNSISGGSDKSPSHLFILPIFSLGHFLFSLHLIVGTALICAVLPLHLAPQYTTNIPCLASLAHLPGLFSVSLDLTGPNYRKIRNLLWENSQAQEGARKLYVDTTGY